MTDGGWLIVLRLLFFINVYLGLIDNNFSYYDFQNHLMIGLVGFTLLQAAPTAPSGCSCQNKTTTEKTVSYKGNGGYIGLLVQYAYGLIE